MLNMTPLDSKGKNSAGEAIAEYLRLTEYYQNAKGEQVSSAQWLGGGAVTLGLADAKFEESDMLALMKGFGPDGKALVQNAGDPERRIGTDMTYSADKSVSLIYAIATPEERERILEAHHKAVDKAFSFSETLAEARKGKAGIDRMSGQLVASRHTHFANRDLEPQLHTHVLCYNIMEAEDGSWGALEADNMMRYQKATGALYRAELAMGMKELGYGIEKTVERDSFDRETGNVFFTVAGVSEEWRDAMSSRRQAILDYQSENGGSMQQAAMATRRHKDEPSYAEMTDIWAKAMADLREQGIGKSIEELKEHGSQLGSKSDMDIVNDLHKTNAVFSRPELLERVAVENVGLMDTDAILKDAKRLARDLMAKEELLPIQSPQSKNWRVGEMPARYAEDHYSARWMVEKEHQVGQRAIARAHDPSVRVAQELVEKSVAGVEAQQGYALTTEQRQAVNHVTHGTGGTCLLSGMAGTGKTTVARAYVAAFQDNGQECIGVSISWDAAKKLESESGIKSYSSMALKQQMENGDLTLNSRHVLVLDEAGMAGTNTIHWMQEQCDKAGAKLILQGDHKQLQPIEAGGAFRLVQQAIGEAKLTEIRRQRDKEDVITAKALYTDHKVAWERMDNRGQIKSFESGKEAIEGITQAYLRNPKSERDKLMLVGTNKEAKAITKLVREDWKQQGKLYGQEHTIKARTGKWEDKLTLMAGDRIRFTKKDKDMEIYNGTRGTVEGIAGSVMSVRLESDIPSQDGRVVKVDTTKFNCFNHAYAVTIHKSQGQDRLDIYQLANATMVDKHMALVGFTRSKENYVLFGSNQDLADYKRKMGMERLKVNATEAGVKTQEPLAEHKARILEFAANREPKLQPKRSIEAQIG